MIYSANYWRSNIEWNIEVELSTNPTTVSVIDSAGTRTVSFSKIGDVLKVSVISPNKSFSLKIDSEDKVLTFENDEEFNEATGDIKAPTRVTSNARYIYLPICQLEKIDIKFYRMNGEELRVERRDSTPSWQLRYKIAGNLNDKMDYLNFKNIPSHEIELLWIDNVRFLQSKETNTWVALRSIPFRAIVSNVNKPQIQQRSSLVLPNDLYGKRYYADFTV